MNITIEVKAIKPGESGWGNADWRLIPIGYEWPTWGESQPFCVHGEKLRWECDHCNKHFEAGTGRLARTRKGTK